MGFAEWLAAYRRLASRVVHVCSVCGRPMTSSFYRASTGETYCARHAGERPCLCCGMPSDSRLVMEIPLCGRCAATAVRDQAAVKRVLPPIAKRIRALSIRTTTPVRVRLVARDELRSHHPEGANALGMTISMGTRVLDLMVVRDLPLVQFGSTVAHEVMHAYLAQQGFGVLPPPVAEGLCQLLAYAWLRDQPDPLAAVERRRIAEDPGPVYGDGFRAARAASQRLGVRAMLDHVRRNGSFP
ncbi:hypothetical protein GCM10010112_06910 [Actinoplanes lobatus]|uniref:Protein DA1-like domain-containing protein n=1 Tax=Actinoplanes lobatus TaxID=113568 RepID=A0A7W7HAP0_9ACTN|nr:protein DA1 [Actinoplanes lobatus]MBB4747111.1 hypothetical protein [Actinoplanes lobatus]GGN55774.1 hypothetical protein GCM10010112_06910 [Actinoplanes lobatus]GIE39321.1 hypothetical protein Alo02nite_22190 [Actinoplanes lobatus]